MDGTISSQEEAQISNKSKRGGWITFPFIMGTMAGMSLAGSGITANLIVYLIREFNMNSITATQISNVANGCLYFFPVFGAIIADSFFTSFTAAFLSSCVSFLGTALLALSATLKSLRPEPCDDGSNLCKPASELQYSVLYLGLTLNTIGGSARFAITTLGANQFDKQDQNKFFNWYFINLYFTMFIGFTAIVYIEDNVSWGLGFGISAIANLIALVILLMGYGFYRHDVPRGRSPFLDLARVLVAAICKWKSNLSSRIEDYYGGQAHLPVIPEKRLRFFNRAALITEGDLGPNGSIAKPWRICTIQQVQDFKTLIGLLSVWSTTIFLSTPIAIQNNLTILQALTMDRHVGSHFKIPASSIVVAVQLSGAIFLILIDRIMLLPTTWWKLIGRSPPTHLQRVGAGHVFVVFGMMVSALIESKRLHVAHTCVHQSNNLAQSEEVVDMSVMWLCPQLVLVGIGEACFLPGLTTFFFQQFPESLKNTSNSMITMVVGISFFLSTAIIDLVRRVTDWLPNDLNHGGLNNLYWMLVLLGVFNFGYFLLCSIFYKN